MECVAAKVAMIGNNENDGMLDLMIWTVICLAQQP